MHIINIRLTDAFVCQGFKKTQTSKVFSFQKQFVATVIILTFFGMHATNTSGYCCNIYGTVGVINTASAYGGLNT